ncbi:MAG: TonB family protein [Dysgonamonadaceae bacterium]|jgi:TonB family protein|nr:TonB family protein [Dysgonamonadaceae bacterium]
MKPTKEKIYGITGSILFHIGLLLILYFTFLRTEIKVKEEGVPVNFGTVHLATGTFTPQSEVNESTPLEANLSPPDQEIPEIPQLQSPKVSTITTSPTKPTPPPIAQNSEQTAAVEAEQARIEQEQRKRDAINRQVSGAFAGNSGRGQQGTKQAQGNPQNVTATAAGGSDYGEFNLGDRTLGAEGLPRPAYSAQEEGNIVVDIVVNPQGNVIRAEIGKGTTINSVTMRKSARDAALKAKFSSISRNSNQSGTITYRYYLK